MEPIKQEIINNIFENGDKLITGPILQTVLIDMIDDVNVKDQEILSKTGSWDDAVTQIPNLATKEEVTNLSESVARDLENVVDVDLTGYATEQWVESQGYLKEHQDISNLATKTELTEAENNLQGNITSLSESVARDLANVSVPEGVATEAWVQSQDYASKSYVDNAVSSSSVDLTGYATETWVESQGYLKEHQDISGLATKTELTSVSESVQTDITNLSESVANSVVWKKGTGTDSIAQVIANGTNPPTATGERAVATGLDTKASGKASHAEGDSTEAKGHYSHAEGSSTIASGWYSHAEGMYTSASGECSHAEGSNTKASGTKSHAEGGYTKALGSDSHAEGSYTEASGKASHAEGDHTKASEAGSHAEGNWTKASGSYSHAEGIETIAINPAEHAQGRYNHNSTNQIFSIGTGNSSTDRRNAVSVLEVDNSGSYTSSFFVQNVGGYDGTNPTPGTNDLATAISKVSSIWKKGEGQDSIAQVITGDGYIQPAASGTGSIATGYSTNASGSWSHAEGSNTLASGDQSHAEGGSTVASGQYSHAEGTGTKALGKFGSHAEGRNTEASGWGSHAEGHNTVASEQYSHAEGSGTKASGFYSHAEGGSTVASGFSSHAEGSDTTASGLMSHAEGSNAKASGNYSHAEGYYTITSNQYEHAQGRYNYTSSNQIFSIGAGDSIKDPDTQVVTETRRNAISVLAVDNSGSYTSSFFVQNIGGYDGTNPEPGTNDLATVINGMSSGGGSSSGGSSETLWKKGTGKDSAVLILTGDDEANTPTATGIGAVAIGSQTEAAGGYSYAEGEHTSTSGWYSHAEGSWTQANGYYSHAEGNGGRAKGIYSHAEGVQTQASGQFSHAEGHFTIASNDYEHAQGTYNHNSPNQIFSIGAGEFEGGVSTRRNAISVLAVPNSDTRINTGSVFVQNVGGYDGTNPLPGTNDLATVLNNTETWTFTLEDGSTVTKNIRIS